MYFYTFGLNEKFCSGVRRYKETSMGRFDKTVEDMFFEWMSHDCDSQSNIALQQKYDELSQSLKFEYGNFFTFAQNISDQKKNFDEETIVLKGDVLRSIMQKSTMMVVRKYTELETACNMKWNFHNSLFFAGTVATTIGYGKLTPQTALGRLFCIVYLSVGIPYFAFLTSTLSDSLNAQLGRLDMKFQKSKDKERHFRISPFKFLYFAGGIILILAVPSAVFTILEGWSKLESFYFSIISLSTIGFGDYIPRNTPPNSMATHVKNNIECLNELANPIPPNRDGQISACVPTKYPAKAEALFEIYRIGCFLWLSFGLQWLGGLISQICNSLRSTKKKLSKPIFRCRYLARFQAFLAHRHSSGDALYLNDL